MSIDDESKTSELVSRGLSSNSDQAKVRLRIDINLEKKILGSFFVFIGLTLWFLAVFFKNPYAAIKDMIHLFKRAK